MRCTLDADGLRGDAPAEDRGAHSRVGGQRRRSWRAAATTLIDAVERWAREIGLAFQIVDDILDVEGSAGNSSGKTAGKDAAGDKPTYPSLFGLERSRAHGRRVRRARGRYAPASGPERHPARPHRRVDGQRRLRDCGHAAALRSSSVPRTLRTADGGTTRKGLTPVEMKSAKRRLDALMSNAGWSRRANGRAR